MSALTLYNPTEQAAPAAMVRPRINDDAGSTVQNIVAIATIGRLFRRSAQTVTIWRTTQALPYIRIPGDGRDSIRFDLEKVRQWGEFKGKRMFPIDEGEVVG